METKKTDGKTAVLCAVCLTVIAAASFCSMQFFTRSVFDGDPRWQLCFAVLALCLILSAAVKKPAVSLAVGVAAAIGTAFYTIYFIPLFFPVALQAALWEGARADGTKTGRAVFSYPPRFSPQRSRSICGC